MKLFLEACGKFFIGVLLVGLCVFLPAGTLHFFNGWLFMGVLFVPMFFAGIVMAVKSPGLLKKRVSGKEKLREQSLVVKLSGLMFIAGFIVAGLGVRFGWYRLPLGVVIGASVVFLAAYVVYGEVLRENAYLSRTIEVQENQKVVDSGLYGVVRHPMYSATLFLFLAMPLILGSVYAFLIFLLYPFIVSDYPKLTNPMGKIVLNHYEVKKGRAFTKDEEKQIIDFCKQHPHYHGNSALLLLMYTGMRVGELKTAEYDGQYITCISEKTRKGRKEIVRKIPVSPMLKRILHMIDFEKAKHTNRDVARDTIKRIFPDRHTHELRYTFITRAKECGVNPEVVMLWVGHEHDQDVRTSKVDRGYTTYSEEYLLSEILKIDYEYEQKC